MFRISRMIRASAGTISYIQLQSVKSAITLRRLLRSPSYEYIEKPFSMDTLVAAILRAARDKADIPQLPLKAADAMRSDSLTRQAAPYGTEGYRLESCRAWLPKPLSVKGLSFGLTPLKPLPGAKESTAQTCPLAHSDA